MLPVGSRKLGCWDLSGSAAELCLDAVGSRRSHQRLVQGGLLQMLCAGHEPHLAKHCHALGTGGVEGEKDSRPRSRSRQDREPRQSQFGVTSDKLCEGEGVEESGQASR